MKIDFPAPSQIPALRRLWQEAFGDTEEFLDAFFSLAFSPTRCRCLTVHGEIAAALYWFATDFEGQRVAYLYAVATKKSHRGQGFCRRLLADTHRLLQEQGYTGALLVPGSSALSAMYQKLGYLPGTTLTEFSCCVGGDPLPLRRISPEEYAGLRRAQLPPHSILQEEENLAFLSAHADFFAGADVLLCAHQDGNDLICFEFLGPKEVAPAVLQALQCSSGTFRTPGKGKLFSLYHPLNRPDIPEYFAFAFD